MTDIESESRDNKVASRAPGPSAATGPTAGTKRRRRLILFFKLFVLALPFLGLIGAEYGCRMRDYGGYPPVFVDVGRDGDYIWCSTFRPGVDSFFYTGLSHTGGMRSWQFTYPKQPDTVRIAMFGGSAMQGYAQELALSDGAFLESMLNDAWGGRKRAEVLNFGATAMASFPAMCFLDDFLKYKPDLVVVMSGNNEFYGAYGVSSLHTAGTSPGGMRFMRWLRGLALKQWMETKTHKIDVTDEIRNQPLMERVAVQQRVAADDPLREAAGECLKANLSHMVEACKSRGIPIIICTVPTNERGMAPVGEDSLDGLSAEKRERFASLLDQAAGSTDAEEQITLLREAVGIAPDHALAHFKLARALEEAGRAEDAVAQYVLARDLDTMPWRATTTADTAIRAAAKGGAVLCDMVAAFRNDSPGGTIGWELMDDHVHMSMRGQALWAETILHEMQNLPEPLSVPADAASALSDWNAYADRLGRNIYNDYVVANRVKKLFSISFMRRNNEDVRERFEKLCDALRSQMSPRDLEAVDKWQDPELHVTNHRPITFVVGYYRMADGDYETAERLFRNARASTSRVSKWRLQLTWYLIKCHRHMQREPTDEDRMLCREAVQVGELLVKFSGVKDLEAQAYLGCVYNLVGNHKAAEYYLNEAVMAARGGEGWDAVRALADSLIHLGNYDRARKLLTLAQRDAEMQEAAKRMLDDLNAKFPPDAAAAP